MITIIARDVKVKSNRAHVQRETDTPTRHILTGMQRDNYCHYYYTIMERSKNGDVITIRRVDRLWKGATSTTA